jgi:sulfur carrier protein ThiS
MIKVKIAPGIDKNKKYNNEFSIEYKEMTLEELLEELSIEKIHVGGILVNGTPKKLNEKVEKNCKIYILPLLGGG